MIYGMRQAVSIDSLIDNIAFAQGKNIDWEIRAKRSMFAELGDTLFKNLSETVTVHEDKGIGTREIKVEVIVYSRTEFNNKLKNLKRILNNNTIPISVQTEILEIFRKDSEEEHKGLKLNRKYI